MTATIISLAEVRKKRVRHRDAPLGETDAGRAETFRLLDQIRCNLGLPPDYRGDWVVMRRPEEGRC
jgi:hypothetical protein